jgi:hypothetical protein
MGKEYCICGWDTSPALLHGLEMDQKQIELAPSSKISIDNIQTQNYNMIIEMVTKTILPTRFESTYRSFY